MMVDISTRYMGLSLNNPIIVGSSGLTDSVDKITLLEKNGAGAVILKSIFEEEIVREMQNTMKGMASELSIYPESLEFYEKNFDTGKSTDKYLQLVSDVKKQVKIPVIASVNCISPDHWAFFPKRLEEAGADALEINMFILPSDLNREAAENEKIYFDVTREITSQLSIPVALKISPYSSGLAAFIKNISDLPVRGIVLFNRFYNPDFDIDTFEVTSANVLSNPGDIFTSLRWIALLSGHVQCDLAASTGIHDAGGMIKQLLAGASATQVVSAIYKNGPNHILTMLDDLRTWMKNKDFKAIYDFQGKMSRKEIKNPAVHERVQFMKYFRGY